MSDENYSTWLTTIRWKRDVMGRFRPENDYYNDGTCEKCGKKGFVTWSENESFLCSDCFYIDDENEYDKEDDVFLDMEFDDEDDDEPISHV